MDFLLWLTAGWDGKTSRLDYKEEKRLKAFFNWMPLRGAAPKRLGCEPLWTLGNQRETLWTPRVEFTRRVENTNETNVPSVWEVDSG
jgi:hypothetical protein